MYYGILLLAEKFLFKGLKEKLPGVINWLITTVLVLIGWVLFYYVDLSQGLHHLGTMFGAVKAELSDPYTVYYFKYYLVFLVAAVLASVPWKPLLQRLPAPPASMGDMVQTCCRDRSIFAVSGAGGHPEL